MVETTQPILEFNSIGNSSDINASFYDQFTIDGIIHNLFKTNVALSIYGTIILLAITLTFGRSFLFFKVSMMASNNLHAKMFHCLLLAPMKFFNINPSGRILNRFSKDIGAIDEILPRVFLDASQVGQLEL